MTKRIKRLKGAIRLAETSQRYTAKARATGDQETMEKAKRMQKAALRILREDKP